MVLENYVVLPEGRPVRLHFTEHGMVDRDIPDPLLGFPKRVTTLVFLVDEEDGRPVAKSLDITAEGLAAQLAGYLVDQQYRRYDIIITRRGSGFGTKYTVVASPRPG